MRLLKEAHRGKRGVVSSKGLTCLLPISILTNMPYFHWKAVSLQNSQPGGIGSYGYFLPEYAFYNKAVQVGTLVANTSLTSMACQATVFPPCVPSCAGSGVSSSSAMFYKQMVEILQHNSPLSVQEHWKCDHFKSSNLHFTQNILPLWGFAHWGRRTSFWYKSKDIQVFFLFVEDFFTLGNN